MKFFYILYFILILSSCASRKDIVYFQGNEQVNTDNYYSFRFKKDDFISINISGIDESSYKLFNSPQSVTNLNKGYTNGVPPINGYLIDVKGNIDFPVLGTIKLEGLTRFEAIELFKSKLKDYLQNPVITIQIQNFRVTILGEVRNPGTFTIPNEKISILESIGLAGDLTINAVRSNIKVIREENNIKKEYLIDITKKDFINSPVFYLNQNDIVYIEPNRAKINSSIVSSAAGVFISIATLLVTTINTISK